MNKPWVYDDRACVLGEGAFWHPVLQKLFWCDIMGRRLLCEDGRAWYFDEHISALGWVDASRLLIASETELFTFDLKKEERIPVHPLEDDNPITRSNDGRADPLGGFWIGTMGKNAEADAGAIYRYHQGKLRKLFAPITISNTICFSPDGRTAYYSDTDVGWVMKVSLDKDGWPDDTPARFLNLASEGLNPDGAVTTEDGDLLVAEWGAARVAQYDGSNGMFKASFQFPTDHITCPALGGPNMSTLFATSASQGLTSDQGKSQPNAGCTFAIETKLTGLSAPQVKL